MRGGEDPKVRNIVEETEAAISFEYLPGAINWADEHFNNGWSHAIDVFDAACVKARETKDYQSAEKAADVFMKTTLDFIRLYKQTNEEADAENLLVSMKKRIQK